MDAMKPHGQALLDYYGGETSIEIILERDDGPQVRLPVSVFFRTPDAFFPLEDTAIELCKGRVLDIGAGTGLHALALQERGHEVTALDISPEAVDVMKRCGVKDVRIGDIFRFPPEPFDTLLLLGHGIGMVENLAGLDRFLKRMKDFVEPDGQLLINSMDVTATDDPQHLSYHQSNIQAFYFYNKTRVNLGFGLFHTKNFYLDNNDFLFSDRFYGAQFLARRPFSIFSRMEFTASHFFIDRQYYDFNDIREDRSSKVATGNLAYVTDNIVWGITGPVNGRRAKFSFTKGINLFDSNDIEFTSAEFDYRRYWHFKRTFSMALRFAGGASFGKTPKLYFLGGTTNLVGNRTVDAEVYEVENLYFSDVVTPLRSIDYYELSGTRYGLVNWEFRFPMIEYFAMRFPLPLVISRVVGVLFTDIGAAWYDNDFKGGTSAGGHNRLQDLKVGFGFGMRANLGFIVLRYDAAWGTDFYTVSEKSSHYFSLGADF